jgi:hypothetical protein
VIDRTFVTYETLERMEQLGIYKNVKYVKETRYDDHVATPRCRRRSARASPPHRPHRGSRRDRRALVGREGDHRREPVGAAARHQPNPFWHGRKPFVVCSAIPDMFQIPGVSVIEGLAQMQEMLWTLTNLRLDATRMAANLITLIRGDVDNPTTTSGRPNAQWIVTDPNACRRSTCRSDDRRSARRCRRSRCCAATSRT